MLFRDVGSASSFVASPGPVLGTREAARADFDVLIACALNYGANAAEFNKLGRIAVKVINHLGDEVMKVFRV